MSFESDRIRELHEEEERMRLCMLKAEAGLVASRDLLVAAERMDWMYYNPTANRTTSTESEALLLGKPIEQKEQADMKERLGVGTTAAGSLFMASLTRQNDDAMRRLREDPLVLIKQAEAKQLSIEEARRQFFSGTLKHPEARNLKQAPTVIETPDSSKTLSTSEDDDDLGPPVTMSMASQARQLEFSKSLRGMNKRPNHKSDDIPLKKNSYKKEEEIDVFKQAKENQQTKDEKLAEMVKEGQSHEAAKRRRLAELDELEKELEKKQASRQLSHTEGKQPNYLRTIQKEAFSEEAVYAARASRLARKNKRPN